MDLGKDSEFYKMYGECWNLFKKYSNPTSWEDIEAYMREAKELEDKYHKYINFVGACLFHYGRMIKNEYEDSGVQRKM